MWYFTIVTSVIVVLSSVILHKLGDILLNQAGCGHGTSSWVDGPLQKNIII